MGLRRELIKMQEREKLSNSAMAKKLGISRMHWYRIKNNKIAVNASIQIRAINIWNELLTPFLFENMRHSNNDNHSK